MSKLLLRTSTAIVSVSIFQHFGSSKAFGLLAIHNFSILRLALAWKRLEVMAFPPIW